MRTFLKLFFKLFFVWTFFLFSLLSMEKSHQDKGYHEHVRIIRHEADDHSRCDSCYDAGSGVCGILCCCAPCDDDQDLCCDSCCYHCGFLGGRLKRESQWMDCSERCGYLATLGCPLNLCAYLISTPENAAWYYPTGKIVSFVSMGAILLASIPCICQKILHVGYRCASRLHAQKAQRYTLGYREARVSNDY